MPINTGLDKGSVIHIHDRILPMFLIKKDEILPPAATWTRRETVTVRRARERGTAYAIPYLLYSVSKKKGYK